MKQHTVMGEQIIAAAGPSLERIGPLVRASHERWDGMGYPDGLAGRGDPARRPHHRDLRLVPRDARRARLQARDARSPRRSAELRRCAGTQFDPELVEVFCRLIAERTEPERVRSATG